MNNLHLIQWHDDEDKGVHCSLTAARNYAFIISDLCCENYGIALLPNRHCPAGWFYFVVN